MKFKVKIIKKPSQLLSEMLDVCPETKEKQKIVDFCQEKEGGDTFILTTAGKTTAWKSKITIRTEEIDINTI